LAYTRTHACTHARAHSQEVNPTGQPPRGIPWVMLYAGSAVTFKPYNSKT